MKKVLSSKGFPVESPGRVVLEKRSSIRSPTEWVEKSGTLMAWAVRSDTKQATHIGMLKRETTGLKCGCVCPACGGILQAVNAGMPAEHYAKPNTLRPFFRHHTGQQHADCLVKVAQIAALQLLVERQEIELPGPSARRSVIGASGCIYTQEAFRPARRVTIIERQWVDEHAAKITLEDGRVVLLKLVGSPYMAADGSVDAIVTINVDDPEVSTWSPDKILEQAQLAGKWLCWERHWDDLELQAEALAKAEKEAHDLIDLPPRDFVLPDGLTNLQRSESVLHWVLKGILGAAGKINTPPFGVVVERQMPEGYIEARRVSVPAMTLILTDVRVEHRLGGLVPDVICRARDDEGRIGSFDLMIEVAVTHRVDQAKKLRIEGSGIACIEFDINLVATAGRVTLLQLTSMVCGDPSNKHWIFHPHLEQKKAIAKDELEKMADKARRWLVLQEQEALWFDALPIHQALNEYLSALQKQWGVRSISTRDSSVWTPADMAKHLISKGFKHADAPQLADRDGLLWQLNAIRQAKEDRDVTGRAFRAFKKAYTTSDATRKFISLVLHAISVYKPIMRSDDIEEFQDHREHIKASIRAGESTFARPRMHDDFIGHLFPELSSGLSKKGGTVEYADEIQSEKRKKQRLLDGERQRAEDAQLATKRDKERIEALDREIKHAIADRCKRVTWTKIGDGIPLDIEHAQFFVSKFKPHDLFDSPKRPSEIIESAWLAREQGVELADWFASCRPQSSGAVHWIATLLDTAWLAIQQR